MARPNFIVGSQFVIPAFLRGSVFTLPSVLYFCILGTVFIILLLRYGLFNDAAGRPDDTASNEVRLSEY
jgi:hypothetical protein